MANADSILSSVKKVVGLDDSYDVFDLDIMMHINSVFSDLNQLGLGPTLGFEITGDTETWDAFTNGDPLLNSVKSYVYLRVKLLFDPPTTSFAITAQEEQVRKAEWRLNVLRESRAWTDPAPVVVQDLEILDGGVIP
jgi:hypothetical protein